VLRVWDAVDQERLLTLRKESQHESSRSASEFIVPLPARPSVFRINQLDASSFHFASASRDCHGWPNPIELGKRQTTTARGRNPRQDE
jgi:hypothetical protein